MTKTIVYLRLWQIIGDEGRNIPPLLPVSRTTFLNRVKSGEYPKSVKLGDRMVAWKQEDIVDLLDRLGGAQ